MKRLFLFALLTLLSVGMLKATVNPTPNASPTYGYSELGGAASAFMLGNQNVSLAQRFIAPLSGYITSIGTYPGNNVGSVSGNLCYSITNFGSSSSPSDPAGVPLAVTSVPVTALPTVGPTPSVLWQALTTPQYVASGNAYYVQVSFTGTTDATDYCTMYFNPTPHMWTQGTGKVLAGIQWSRTGSNFPIQFQYGVIGTPTATPTSTVTPTFTVTPTSTVTPTFAVTPTPTVTP